VTIPEPGPGAVVEEAAVLFNRGRYHECHEVLEAQWRESSGRVRLALQSLILLAASFHHLQRGHPRRAGVVLDRCRGKLAALGRDPVARLDPTELGRLVVVGQAAVKKGDWGSSSRVDPHLHLRED
jgi:hypothetical protein